MNRYAQFVGNKVNEEIGIIQSQRDVKEQLKQAIDSNGNESNMGWATAGLFSFALSRAFKAIEAVAFTGPAQFKEPYHDLNHKENIAMKEYALAIDPSLVAYIPNIRNFEPAQFNAVAAAPNHLNNVIMGGSLFNDHEKDGTGSSAINQIVTKLWWDTSWNQSKEGVLKTTLLKFSSEDPILVLTEMGSRIYKIGFIMFEAKVAADIGSIAEKIPVIGVVFKFAKEICNSSIYVAIMWFFLFIGVLLKFVAPLTPLAIWLFAYLGWLLRVIEIILAAPVWAVAHAMPEGNGFAGNSARRGYFLCLDVAMRPILMVIGAILSIALWRIAGHGFGQLVTKALNAFTVNDLGLDTQMFLSVAIMFLFWVLYARIFVALIQTFPDRIMSWIGQSGGDGDLGGARGAEQQFGAFMLRISDQHRQLMSNIKPLGVGKGPNDGTNNPKTGVVANMNDVPQQMVESSSGSFGGASHNNASLGQKNNIQQSSGQSSYGGNKGNGAFGNMAGIDNNSDISKVSGNVGGGMNVGSQENISKSQGNNISSSSGQSFSEGNGSFGNMAGTDKNSGISKADGNVGNKSISQSRNVGNNQINEA